MGNIYCPSCRLEQPTDHTFCVSCGTPLPVQLVTERPGKVARFFAGVKVDEHDPEHGFLRVSCYRSEEQLQGAEGSVRIPQHHVRFSVWVADEARCVLSLPISEARELCSFLGHAMGGVDDDLYARS
jgi:hypothetical protein